MFAELPTGDADLLIPKVRKGTVLLDERAQPHATSHFRAYMILTNGQWPARGLVSGCWPPEDTSSAGAGGASDTADSARTVSEGAKKRASGEHNGARDIENGPAWKGREGREGRHSRASRGARRAMCTHVIHCGCIRQAARLEWMQELPQHASGRALEVAGVNMTAAAAAAAVLLDAIESRDEDVEDEDGDAESAGTLVHAAFEFMWRQEWLVPGMRFVVRDQRGHVSGVGVIRTIT